MMKRNPYLGQTVDPYHGAEWIDTNRPIPDVSRHTLDVQGQTIDALGHRLMEPRGANPRVEHHVPPAPVSMSVESTATSATLSRIPPVSEMNGMADRQDRHVIQNMVRGAAIGAAIGYAIGRPLEAYIMKSRRNRIRVMTWFTVFFSIIAVLPWVGMAALPPGRPAFLWFAAAGVLLLVLLWLAAIFGKQPLPPPTAIQATDQRP